MKIVVACDSMKGSLTSDEVGRAARTGIISAFADKSADDFSNDFADEYASCIADESADVEVIALNVADGGEGTAEAVTAALDGRMVTATVDDPLRDKVTAKFGIVDSPIPIADSLAQAGADSFVAIGKEFAGIIEDNRTAIIDMAAASGLTLIGESRRNPLITTSYGTGQLIAAALDAGCHHLIVGLGGSATNDGGKGMLEALGVRFFDAEGQLLPDGGASLDRLDHIDTSGLRPDFISADITLMCDVDNPLCGANGASAVYGPQKGASQAMVKQLDAALGRFAQVAAECTGRDVADIPGAGAAGGLGAAFLAFSNARLRRGADVVLDILHFNRTIADADLVITGEGRLDRQTLSGKLPYSVLRRCRQIGVPVVAIAGIVADKEDVEAAGFDAVAAINEPDFELAHAMRPDVAAANVRRTCAAIVKRFGR